MKQRNLIDYTVWLQKKSFIESDVVIEALTSMYAEQLKTEAKADDKTLHIDSIKARYFRVTFSANHPKGVANGAVMYVTNKTYLGGAETIADIKLTNGVTNVAILSITELAEDDYNYYMNN